MRFTERLYEAIKSKDNPTAMGLDPTLDAIPDAFRRQVAAETQEKEPTISRSRSLEEILFRFNQSLIDATADIIPAIKPQLAYYEMYGLPGLTALRRTIEYAHSKGLLVICDGKRNDIGPTARAYARAYLGGTDLSALPTQNKDSEFSEPETAFWNADALTVNAYLGIDGLRPFMEEASAHDKGLFVLVRTSNPSAGDFQDLRLAGGRLLYEAVAERLTDWAGDSLDTHEFSLIGAVVGATWPQQAASLRRLLPHAYILVPGYGAQGGGAEDCAPSFRPDGTGALVNASRSLICAWKKDGSGDGLSFASATRREAEKMRDALNRVLGQH